MAAQLQTESKALPGRAFTPVLSGLLQRKCATCGNHTVAGWECAECAKKKSSLQRKLTIGASNHHLEQEADRVADQVMSMPLTSKVNPTPPRIQRFSGQAAHESLEAAPPSVDRVLSSPGTPLEPSLRQDMEGRFGHDFSQVRVHTGSAAEQSARDVNADAYTVGNNVVFGVERYAPGTHEGRRLIAHELTHILQQSSISGILLDQSSEKFDQASNYQQPRNPNFLQRTCGPESIGSIEGCRRRGGDITDYGGSSERIFFFKVDCDEFLPGEKDRLRRIVRRDVSATDIVEIDGFASEEGNPKFNDNLSCARALVADSVLKLETTAATMLYKHGAVSGFRDDRRSVVLTIQPTVSEYTPEKVSEYTPENCSALIGNCEFYLCRERRHSCGPRGYYLGYGFKYCDRFSRILRPRLSTTGQRWIDQTRRCLMQYIDRNIPINTQCDEVKRSAFDSHPQCYVSGGVCFLDQSDWAKILGIIDSEDNDFKQMIITGVYCLGNWAPMAFPVHSLGAGGGYRGLMERDRRRTFGF